MRFVLRVGETFNNHTEGDVNVLPDGSERDAGTEGKKSRPPSREFLSHDAFRPNALGDDGWLWIHQRFATRSSPPGLAEWLDAVARSRGTAGALEADIGQHRRERAEWRASQDVNVSREEVDHAS